MEVITVSVSIGDSCNLYKNVKYAMNINILKAFRQREVKLLIILEENLIVGTVK